MKQNTTAAAVLPSPLRLDRGEPDAILVVAEMIPDSVLNEDEQLQMIYDTAVTRSGGAE